ncbi:unnamed protein product [Effrenium voratum]|uniref:Ribokinase n=1 Tax=Effrenium voratum TaxID=2562239 RepID=A0AA36JN93_9DINO|nr:unnamed protein product [Effrenium voratum]CAJ1423700.1 unnamed protein product [Effrenium voratum]CAJ1427491.1 unnamed protein product [Effrenium voratum]
MLTPLCQTSSTTMLPRLSRRFATMQPQLAGSGHRWLPWAAAATAAAGVVSYTYTGRKSLACEQKPLLVCGSLNADIIIEINRFPKKGETLSARSPDTGIMVPGGKGANQAVAAARLSAGTGRQAKFVCQFGNDSHAFKLEQVLREKEVDIGNCGRSNKPSGQAFIFLEEDGSNSILIVGGSNVAWPKDVNAFAQQIRGASAVLLQREIPEYVNEAVSEVAVKAGVPVIQDVGGEERDFSDAHLKRLTYICPNETELERLTGMPTSTQEEVVAAAKSLQKRGVKNVLCTLGADGAVLVGPDGSVLRQPGIAVPGGKVVDTTGAGDCFRAAFAVAMVEGKPLEECLKFAAAAGAITVSRYGAVPSLPERKETDALAHWRGAAAS